MTSATAVDPARSCVAQSAINGQCLAHSLAGGTSGQHGMSSATVTMLTAAVACAGNGAAADTWRAWGATRMPSTATAMSSLDKGRKRRITRSDYHSCGIPAKQADSEPSLQPDQEAQFRGRISIGRDVARGVAGELLVTHADIGRELLDDLVAQPEPEL